MVKEDKSVVKVKPRVKVDPEHAASRQRALDIKVAQQGGK